MTSFIAFPDGPALRHDSAADAIAPTPGRAAWLEENVTDTVPARRLIFGHRGDWAVLFPHADGRRGGDWHYTSANRAYRWHRLGLRVARVTG